VEDFFLFYRLSPLRSMNIGEHPFLLQNGEKQPKPGVWAARSDMIDDTVAGVSCVQVASWSVRGGDTYVTRREAVVNPAARSFNM
jgi:hypothetical protein